METAFNTATSSAAADQKAQEQLQQQEEPLLTREEIEERLAELEAAGGHQIKHPVVKYDVDSASAVTFVTDTSSFM